MGMFSGTNEAQAASSANLKLTAGRYPELTVVSCKGKQGLKNPNHVYYIVTFEVTADAVQTEGTEPLKKGARADWLVNLNDTYGYGKRDSKSLALAILGNGETDVEKHLEGSLTGGFNGMKVAANVFTKENGYVTTRFERCTTSAQASPPAPEAAKPAPAAAPAAPAAEPEGGPWYAFPEPDPRGTHYNAKGEVITL